MTVGDSSLLLWVMAAVVALLSAYLFIGWVRRAQSLDDWRQWMGLSALGGGALGLGISSAMVLAMSAEALAFPLGYRWLAVPALFLAPPLLCVPAALWLSRSHRWPALLGAALLITAVAVATHGGWLLAAGLRPGLRWNFQLVGAAAALGLSGFTAALWLAYSDASGDGARKSLWRVGAAVLMALTLVAGQEVIVSAVSLLLQVGSVYQREASSTWLCLVAGALVPIVMAVLALDLALRNKGERRRRNGSGSGNSVLGARRKRRRKYRTL
jgi:NO-binding membrane sensor protein with MHYT domain